MQKNSNAHSKQSFHVTRTYVQVVVGERSRQPVAGGAHAGVDDAALACEQEHGTFVYLAKKSIVEAESLVRVTSMIVCMQVQYRSISYSCW